MKRIVFALAFMFFAALYPAAAADQIDTVTVQADSLRGFWKIGFPFWTYREGMKFQFGPMSDDYCRMEDAHDDLHVYCFRFSNDRGDNLVGDVTLNGNRVHISWGTMMVAINVDATRQPSNIFTGNYALRLAGIPIHAPDQLNVSKIAFSGDTPDAGGKAALLMTILNSIADSVPMQIPTQLHEGALLPTAKGLRALGKLQSVVYLGRNLTFAEVMELMKDDPGLKEKGPPSMPSGDPSSIYAVEFSEGERLCAIRQRPDSVVDAVGCI